MASLQNSTVNGTLTATTSFSSAKLLTSAADCFHEYTGTVSIPSSANSATNYADIFANTGTHERMYGLLFWWVNQSQYQCGAIQFQLSEYGLNATTLLDSSGYFSVSRYNPSYGTNYLRFTNTVGTSWGNGTYYFTVRVSGLGGYSFSSSYLTTQVR